MASGEKSFLSSVAAPYDLPPFRRASFWFECLSNHQTLSALFIIQMNEMIIFGSCTRHSCRLEVSLRCLASVLTKANFILAHS